MFSMSTQILLLQNADNVTTQHDQNLLCYTLEAQGCCGIRFYYSADALPVFTLTRSAKEWCFSLFSSASPDAWKTTKIQRAKLLKNLAGAIVLLQRLVETKSQWTNTSSFLSPHKCVSSFSFYGYDCWEFVCSGTKDNLKKVWHMFLWVFYCLVPACLSMYNCKQLCQGQLTWHI